MDIPQTIGFVAATCTTLGFFPQAVKAYKTKHTKDISVGMYSLSTFGIFLWLVYGITQKDVPLIAANTISVITSGSILVMKLIYK